MFIEDNDVVSIVVYYKKIGKINYVAYSEKELKENVQDEKEQAKYKKLTVKMKALTWGVYNELQDISNIFDENLNRKIFNFKKYKEERLKKLIVGWDAMKSTPDGKQIPVPVNESSIINLAPSIAETIINIYDDVSILDDEDEKK
jgi:hypothetical protein